MRLQEADLPTVIAALHARVPAAYLDPELPIAGQWYAALNGYALEVVEAAAESWMGARFPSLSEFAGHVEGTRRAMADVERERNERGQSPCPDCDGTLLVEEATGMRPCQRCNLDGWLLWASGHKTSGHEACSQCKDPKELLGELRREYAEAFRVQRRVWPRRAAEPRAAPGSVGASMTVDRIGELRRQLAGGVVRRVPDADEEF